MMSGQGDGLRFLCLGPGSPAHVKVYKTLFRRTGVIFDVWDENTPWPTQELMLQDYHGLVIRLHDDTDKKEISKTVSYVQFCKSKKRSLFVAVIIGNNDGPWLRLQLVQNGCTMVVKSFVGALCDGIGVLKESLKGGAKDLQCPICQGKFSTEGFPRHYTLFHVHTLAGSPKKVNNCPVCKEEVLNGQLNKHIHRHREPSFEKEGFYAPPLYSFGIVVVQRPWDGKFLLTHERDARGFWLPGGKLDPGEDPITAAKRETLEEAGVDIEITGILQVQFTPSERFCRLRFVFYGVPRLPELPAKSMPDIESAGACWASVDELNDIPLRGSEPKTWFRYVAEGGKIHDLAVLDMREQ